MMLQILSDMREVRTLEIYQLRIHRSSPVSQQSASNRWQAVLFRAGAGSIDDRPWPEAGGYWQRIYRSFAERALGVMERGR